MPKVIGGRYGLSSKEFTPAMVKGIFDELAKAAPKNHFTIGIDDDVSHTSLTTIRASRPKIRRRCARCSTAWARTAPWAPTRTRSRSSAPRRRTYAQGYFVYDSKKSGSMTTSHLRFGPKPIRSTYLITRASFVACHNFSFLEKMDVLEAADARRGVPAELALFGRRGLGQPAQDRAAGDHRARRSSST